jgi:hypothetical protein
MKFDGAIGVLVQHLENLPAHSDADAELFVDFTGEAVLEILPGFALPAGEFPEILEVNAARPPSDQVPFSASHDRCRYDDCPCVTTHRLFRSPG